MKKKGGRFRAQSVRKLFHAIWSMRKALLTNFYLPFANFSVKITGGRHSEMLMIFCNIPNHICSLFMLMLLYNLNQRHDNTKEIRMCAYLSLPHTNMYTFFFFFKESPVHLYLSFLLTPDHTGTEFFLTAITLPGFQFLFCTRTIVFNLLLIQKALAMLWTPSDKFPSP